MSPRGVLLVGAHGYGEVHRERLARLVERVELLGTVDPGGPPREGHGSDLPSWASLDAALAKVRPEVVIVSTPTPTHAALAEAALRAGAHVYLEKPPFASMGQFEHLLAVQRDAGLAVQIGFQSLGSRAIDELAELGAPWSVAAWGAWSRDDAYWTRSPWAGRRELDGLPAMDGVVTNPLAHASATALRLAGARRREDVARVEVDLYRAHEIEADDTSSIRVTLRDGRIVAGAFTLCAEEPEDPRVEVRTQHGDVEVLYTRDIVVANGVERHVGRRDLFEELLDHIDGKAPLSSSLADAGAFMEVVEAVRLAPEVVAIPSERRVTEGGGRRSVLPGIATHVASTARALALFRERRLPWLPERNEGAARALRSDRGVLAGTAHGGDDVAASSSPRPYLHPLLTLGGVPLTDAHPQDHDWHLGAGFAVQDVNGTNLWGGRTFVRREGYRWLDDHGRIVEVSSETTPGLDRSESRWLSRAGETLLRERRTIAVSDSDEVRAFHMRWELTPEGADVVLGSPASNGREGGAGYGGFFWRLPRAAGARVLGPGIEGEDAVHGAETPWIAWQHAGATLAVLAEDRDRWFVRLAGYPAIGRALAWERPLVIDAGETLVREIVALAWDGAVAADEIAERVRDRLTAPPQPAPEYGA